MNKPQVNFEEQAPPITMPAQRSREDRFVPQGQDPYIELITGARFHYGKPIWDIGAIAHSLSLTCRFAGQCRKFYSVAEHSVLVSRIMEDVGLGDPMEGLLHDGAESVLSDVARPAKLLLKDYRQLDKALEHSLRKSFNLSEYETDGCKHADVLALALETKELMPSKGIDCDYGITPEIRAQANRLTYQVQCWTSDNAKEKFMQRMTDIRRRVRGLR